MGDVGEYKQKAVTSLLRCQHKVRGEKNVLALTTLVSLATTIDDNKNKPAILKLYDFTKGSSDIVDQRIGTYTANTAAKRWTMSVSSYLLDTARVNSQTLRALTQLNIIAVSLVD